MTTAPRTSSAEGPEAACPRPAAAPQGRPAAPVRDLLAGWEPGDFLLERWGGGVLARGVAHRIEIPAGAELPRRAARFAARALASSGTAAGVVVGALPFGGEAPAELVVPAAVTWSPPAGDRGRGFVPAASPAATLPAPRPPAHAAAPMAWRAMPSAADFAASVGEAIRRIRAGELEKVVLARALRGPNPGVDARALLGALRAADPGAHVFAASAGPGRVFLGATHETLVRRAGPSVLALPQAGTAARSPDPVRDREAAAALAGSEKERHEHAIVVDAVTESLAPFCSELRADPEPRLVATSAVWHLESRVEGRLRGSPGALDLAAALHPTPAVCGSPTPVARRLIAELEPEARGLYGGLAGWMDARGDGEWVVSLRCALLDPGGVLLHAGVGVVAESDPDAEVAETDAKFRTVLDAVRALGLS